MPIKKIQDSNKKQDYYSYVTPESKVLYEIFSKIELVSFQYAKKREIKPNELIIDKVKIGKIARRLDERKEYYKIYHKNIELSEIRQAALIAYWILKYKPFSINMEEPEKWQQLLKINECIARHIILSVITKIMHPSKFDSNVTIDVSDRYMKKIIYAFSEHDLTKEAVVMIAESLLEKAS